MNLPSSMIVCSVLTAREMAERHATEGTYHLNRALELWSRADAVVSEWKALTREAVA